MKLFFKIVLLLMSVFCLVSCFSLSIGTKKDPSRIQMKGLASAYASADWIEPYDGTVMRAGIFSESDRDGEWASVDIWPLGGVGVGLVGARVRLLFFEIGAGVLAYKPQPRNSKESNAQPAKETPASDTKEKPAEKAN